MSVSHAAFPSILDRVIKHAERIPQRLALRFPGERAGEEDSYSWANLLALIQALAASFRASGVQRSDQVAIVSSSEREQVCAFLACMYLGALPTICSFPSPKHTLERFRIALEPLLDDLQPAWILLGGEQARRLDWMTSKAASGTLVVQLPSSFEALGPTPLMATETDGIAFLQYSSGTTGFRKCIPVTHRMFARYAFAYNGVMAYGDSDRVVSWLPLYHDMGLIGAFLVPLFFGVESVHLSPFYWLRRPDVFYRTIAALRGTVIYLPNFAFNYSAQRVSPEDLHGVDLGCLRAVINGSEPVRAGSLQTFAERFGPAGVPYEALQAVYGMAEAVMATTQSRAGCPLRIDHIEKDAFLRSGRAVPAIPGERQALSYVSCGHPLPGCELRIVGTSLERVAGEIELRCDWLFGGYSSEAGTLPANLSEDGWYRTGDTGYLAEGELFVTGRKKDVIVHRGKNIHPSDLEDLLLQRVVGVKAGRAVVFGVDDPEQGTEQIVVMLEPQSPSVDPRQIRRAVRALVLELFDINVKDVVLCEADTLRKSSSGKLSRSQNRDLYLKRSEAAPRPQVAEGSIGVYSMLQEIWSQVLEQPAIGLDDLLFEDLGADSLDTMIALTRIAEGFGVELDPASLIHAQTLRGQAALIGAALRHRVHHELLIRLRHGAEPSSPLYLAPGADGHAYNYLRLVKGLRGNRPIKALVSPSLHPGQPVMTEPQHVELFRAAILADAGDKPLVLGGWSYGGLLAYRLARSLAEKGKSVRALVVFDIGPDISPNNRLLLRERARLEYRLLDKPYDLGAAIPAWFQKMLDDTLRYSPTDRLIMGVRHGTSRAEFRQLADFVLRGYHTGFELDRPGETGFELLERLSAQIEAIDGERHRQTLLSGLDGEQLHRAALVFKENIFHACGFDADWIFPGTLHVFSQPGSPFAAQWQRLCLQPVCAHEYPFQPLRGKTAHASIMDSENVHLFASDLDEILEGYD